MPLRRCQSPAEGIQNLDRIKAEALSGLFLFFGSDDPVTGESWCPDCVTADPVLRNACRTVRPDLDLHECPVGQRSEWKNAPGHPYRGNPDIRLQRIPTLVFIERGCERGRLVEADCAKPDLVRDFLRK